MKQILLVITVVSVFSFSNNSESPIAPSDTIAIKKVDSSSENIAVPTAAMLLSELTSDEIKDDSIFADGSKPTSWSNAGIDDPVAFKKFLKKSTKLGDY